MKRGFSLLEVLAAMFILALCMALLLQILPFSRYNQRQAENLTQAAFLAQGVCEQLLVDPSDEWPTAGSFDPPMQSFRYEVSRAPWEDNKNMEKVQIEVYSGDKDVCGLVTLVKP